MSGAWKHPHSNSSTGVAAAMNHLEMQSTTRHKHQDKPQQGHFLTSGQNYSSSHHVESRTGTRHQSTGYPQQPQGTSYEYPQQRQEQSYSKYQLALLDVKQHFEKIKHKAKPETAEIINNFEELYGSMLRYLSKESTNAVKQKNKIEEDRKTLEVTKKILSDQVSHSMSRQLSQNESSLENISIKCRPSNVLQEFESLWTTEWHAAKECLDELELDEFNKYTILLEILKQAYVQALADLKDHLKLFTKSTVKRFNIIDALRVSADEGNIPDFTTKIQSSLAAKYNRSNARLGEILSPEKARQSYLQVQKLLKEYIKACGDVAWKMVIQKPSMELYFDLKDGKFDDKYQEPHWGSDDPKRGRVRCYVYPALIHQEMVLKKGSVLVTI